MPRGSKDDLLKKESEEIVKEILSEIQEGRSEFPIEESAPAAYKSEEEILAIILKKLDNIERKIDLIIEMLGEKK